MTIELYWQPTLYSIIISALWIFRDTALVLWARNMKKRETKPKFINILLATGIILLAWSIIYAFLPGFRGSYSSDSEFKTVITIFYLYDIIPIILGIFLGVALSIYFFRLKDRRNKKALLGPGIFLLGYIIYLFFITSFYYALVEEPLLWIANYNAYLIGFVITCIAPVIGFCFIFLSSLRLKNEFLIMFCGLFFAYLTLSLINNLNLAISDFNFFG